MQAYEWFWVPRAFRSLLPGRRRCFWDRLGLQAPLSPHFTGGA